MTQLKPKDSVSHVSDDITGAIINVDYNLSDITTCKVLWDDQGNSDKPDIQWTNKLF